MDDPTEIKIARKKARTIQDYFDEMREIEERIVLSIINPSEITQTTLNLTNDNDGMLE